MGKKTSLFILLILVNITVYSQNERQNDSIIMQDQQNELIEISPIENTFINTTLIKAIDNEVSEQEYINNRIARLTYDFNFRRNLQSLQSKKSESYSFNEYSFNYGIGQYHQGGIQLAFKPTDKLKITLDGSTVQYNILHSHYNDIVFNFDATYTLTDWLQASVFGQYSVKGAENSRNGGYMFSPQTNYGGKLIVKPSDKIEFDLGINRTYHPMLKSWKTGSIVSPRIRLR